MNKERGAQSPTNPDAVAPPELQRILRDLESPDATMRANAVRALCPCRGVQWGVPVFRYVWRMRNDPNPIVRRAVRHDLKENPWWSAHQEDRPEAGPNPRTAKVTLAVKGTALAGLCEGLQTETGVPLAADSSVAHAKVTLFCERVHLRDVMQQLCRTFGYAWVWSKKRGIYRCELMRAPRSQRPEELRNRDRLAARWALENAVANAVLAHDRALRRRVTTPSRPASQAAQRVTSADALEALHQAVEMPIVADYGLQFYAAETVALHDQPLFAGLNQLADTMGLRWRKDGEWLQFRRAGFEHR